MITFVATTDDISRVRFALSPLTEEISSIRMMVSPTKAPAHRPWVDEVRPRLRRIDFRPLRALVPPTGYVPDFLTPPPGPGGLDFATQLEIVRSTRSEDLADEIAWMMTDPVTSASWKKATAPIHRRMLDSPERAIVTIVDQLAAYWRLALEPHWPRMQGGLQTDIRSRMRVIESSGAAAAFSSLNELIGWRNGRLTVHSSYAYEANMGGRGLVLIPSIFCGPEVLTMLPPLQPMMIYPHPAAGKMWGPPQARASQPLAALLGAVRAAVLEALTTPTSTGELATEIGVTPGAVSQHLGVLRDCGLVTSRRVGRRVVHSRTAVGEDLCLHARPPTRTWSS